MKSIIYLLTLNFLLLSYTTTAQCTNIAVTDSSFESGVFNYSVGVNVGWGRDDGANFVTSPVFDGTYAVCSNGGGVYQRINVLPNTTYHFSCWVKNGLHDFSLRVDIGVSPSSQSLIDTGLVSMNDWEFVSMPFFTGSDSIVGIRYWSGGACVDAVKVTCQPIITATVPVIKKKAIQCYPNPTKQHSTLIIDNFNYQKYTLILYNSIGQVVKIIPNITQNTINLTRGNLSNGVYFYQIKNIDKIQSGKWILE